MTSPIYFPSITDLSLFLPISVILVQTIIVFRISLQQPPNYFPHIPFIPSNPLSVYKLSSNTAALILLFFCLKPFNGYSLHQK